MERWREAYIWSKELNLYNENFWGEKLKPTRKACFQNRECYLQSKSPFAKQIETFMKSKYHRHIAGLLRQTCFRTAAFRDTGTPRACQRARAGGGWKEASYCKRFCTTWGYHLPPKIACWLFYYTTTCSNHNLNAITCSHFIWNKCVQPCDQMMHRFSINGEWTTDRARARSTDPLTSSALISPTAYQLGSLVLLCAHTFFKIKILTEETGQSL